MNPVSKLGFDLIFWGLRGLQMAKGSMPPQDPHGDPAILHDLLDVGPGKPLGYLPLTTLRRHGLQPRAFRRSLVQRGLKTRLFVRPEYVMLPPRAGRQFSLAVQREHAHLYAWHEPSLQAMLDAHRDVLRSNRWPTKAGGFVQRVASRSAKEPHLYRLVGRAFNDQRPQWPIDDPVTDSRAAPWP